MKSLAETVNAEREREQRERDISEDLGRLRREDRRCIAPDCGVPLPKQNHCGRCTKHRNTVLPNERCTWLFSTTGWQCPARRVSAEVSPKHLCYRHLRIDNKRNGWKGP